MAVDTDRRNKYIRASLSVNRAKDSVAYASSRVQWEVARATSWPNFCFNSNFTQECVKSPVSAAYSCTSDVDRVLNYSKRAGLGCKGAEGAYQNFRRNRFSTFRGASAGNLINASPFLAWFFGGRKKEKRGEKNGKRGEKFSAQIKKYRGWNQRK